MPHSTPRTGCWPVCPDNPLSGWLSTLVTWIQAHPQWAYTLVFLSAALESLAIVGLFMPGAAIMFAIGALVAADALSLSHSLIMAAAGAVTGDGISFWLGRHYHQQLRVIWPFNRYPRLFNRGVEFFSRHGGKSVLFARFIGPVRPILPAVAGMLDMPAGRFFTVNILSALLWAPAYIIPGLVFGASLGLAAEVAGRLVILLVLLVLSIWLSAWLIHRLFNYAHRHVQSLVMRLQAWGREHPVTAPMLGALLEPDHPEARGLVQMTGLLVLALLGLALLLNLSLTGVDHWVFALLQDLHTPLATRAMRAITALGSLWVLGPLLAAALLWLALHGNRSAFWHGLLAAATALVLVYLLKALFHSPRPLPLYDGISQYSFPSSHTAMSVTVLGFLAVLMARDMPPVWRWLPYSLAALVSTAVALSRLYLGAHWLSDVLGGLLIGIGVVALFGIAYRRHPAPSLAWKGLLVLCLSVTVPAMAWKTPEPIPTQTAMSAPAAVPDRAQWWHNGWQQLPAWRIDLADSKRHPLNVQFAGDPAELSAMLATRGWKPRAFPHWADALRWLTDQTDPLQYPLLPQVHDGHHETVRWVHPADDHHLYVLRLWPAFPRQTQPTLWLGSVTLMKTRSLAGVVHYLVTTDQFDAAVEFLQKQLPPGLLVRRVGGAEPLPYRRLLISVPSPGKTGPSALPDIPVWKPDRRTPAANVSPATATAVIPPAAR